MKKNSILISITIIAFLLLSLYNSDNQDSRSINSFKTTIGTDFVQEIEILGKISTMNNVSVGSPFVTMRNKSYNPFQFEKQILTKSDRIYAELTSSYKVSTSLSTVFSKETAAENLTDNRKEMENGQVYSSNNVQLDGQTVNNEEIKWEVLKTKKIEDYNESSQKDNTDRHYGYVALATNMSQQPIGGSIPNEGNRQLSDIDPDGDPVGPPIPVPDGFYELSIMAIVYGITKSGKEIIAKRFLLLPNLFARFIRFPLR